VTGGTLEERALAGDRQAWNDLAVRHDRSVRLVLLARGVLPEEARDLVQETWVRLIERQARGELAELRLPGLAIAQALFLARDARRRAGRDASALDGAQAEALIDPAASAEETLLGRRRLERVRRAIAGLSPSTQAVFQAVFAGEPTRYREVARRLGLSEQRVKQIVCEIRRAVRAELEKRDD
jgi:RNA polymerase sigma factor (sigma-70 family)